MATLALKTPDDLDAARALIAEHAGDASPGGRSDAGTPVLAPAGDGVVEWLVQDGTAVTAGQPLARVHPRGGAA